MKVKLVADYKYTLLVPITNGSYYEADFNGSTSPQYDTQYGSYGVTGHEIGEGVYGGGTTPTTYNDYGVYISTVRDYVNNCDHSVYASAPVHSVEKTIRYEKEVECYVIDTNAVIAAAKDVNVYLKDFKKKTYVTENYSFAKAGSSFSVTYKYPQGFTVKGITRSANISWISNTTPLVSAKDFKGELLEWWPDGSDVHYYTTPDRVNKDINVDIYLDNGATICFLDAGNPTKIAKVKIGKRASAPKINLVESKNGSLEIRGLTSNKAAIRVIDNDNKFITMPSSLVSAGIIGSKYLLDGDKVTAQYGDPSFWIYTGGKSLIPINTLFGIAENRNVRIVTGGYIEAQVVPTANKPASAISATYINRQNIFSIGKSDDHAGITLKTGSITISCADANNKYEYCVMEGSELGKWTSVNKSKPVSDKRIAEGAKICVRKKAATTNDKTTLLPSSYVCFTYHGLSKDIPNEYYADDYVINEAVEVEIVNDTRHSVTINGATVSKGSSVKISTGVFSNTTYSFKDDTLVKTLSAAVAASADVSGTKVSAGLDKNTIDYFDTPTISVSRLEDAANKLVWSVTTTQESYASHSAATSNFSFTDAVGGTHIVSVAPETKDDSAQYEKTFEAADGSSVTYHPVHIIRYILDDN